MKIRLAVIVVIGGMGTTYGAAVGTAFFPAGLVGRPRRVRA